MMVLLAYDCLSFLFHVFEAIRFMQAKVWLPVVMILVPAAINIPGLALISKYLLGSDDINGRATLLLGIRILAGSSVLGFLFNLIVYFTGVDKAAVMPLLISSVIHLLV